MGRHRMHQNSLDTWEEIEDGRTERAELIYDLLINRKSALSDREIADALGFDDMNMVRPRITELRDSRWVVEKGRIKCPVTRKPVRIVMALTPAQRDDLIENQKAQWARAREKRNAGRPVQLAFSL